MRIIFASTYCTALYSFVAHSIEYKRVPLDLRLLFADVFCILIKTEEEKNIGYNPYIKGRLNQSKASV